MLSWRFVPGLAGLALLLVAAGDVRGAQSPPGPEAAGAETSATDGNAAAEKARLEVEEARARGDTEGLVRALISYAQALRAARRTGASVAPLREAASSANEAGMTSAAARALSDQAVAFILLGRLDEAQSSALEALRLAEKAQAPATEASAAQTVGMIYRNLGRAEEALRYFERAETAARSAGSVGAEASALNEQGNALAILKSYPEAVKRHEKALVLARKAGDLYTAGCVANDLGLTLGREGNPRRARRLVEEAYLLHTRNGSTREACLAAGNLSYFLGELNEPVEARRWAEVAVRLATTGGNPPEEEAARARLADSLAAIGSYERAYEELARAYGLRSEISSAESARRIADLGAFYEAETRKARIELLERDQAIQTLALERERSQRGALVTGAGALTILTMLLAAGYRSKVRANRVIGRKNEELAAARDALELLARTDSLTGLANRRHVEARLHEETLRSARSGAPFSIVMMDLDHFKVVNDTHGHAAGDQVLRQAAAVARELSRALDTVGRWGGEELLFVLPMTPLEGAVKLAEKVRQGLAASPIEVNGLSFAVTATFGVAESDGSSSEVLVRRADEALYEGKEAGRNRVVAVPRTVALA
ncbi:MAG: GGDEF domain-containing protein [Holophagales bacterium]|nr:GGDEF domain-containing protein [Holophagales bacterium]